MARRPLWKAAFLFLIAARPAWAADATAPTDLSPAPVSGAGGAAGASLSNSGSGVAVVPTLSAGMSVLGSAPGLSLPTAFPAAAAALPLTAAAVTPAAAAPAAARAASAAEASLAAAVPAPSPATAATAVVAAGRRSAASGAGKAAAAEPDSAADAARGRIFFDQAAPGERDDETALPAAGGAREPARLKPSAALTDRPSPAEQKVLDKIAKDLGPVVEPAEAPALYAAVETTFGRLSAAQEKLFPADSVPVNRVRVIDTPVVNAFVYPLRTPGVRRSNNMVFVTTGLLKKMLDADPAKLREGMTRVAGVLAHELAHPLDDVDAQGVLTNYGRELGGQAREIRADSEGAMIAKEAGYPASAVHDALLRLFEGEPKNSGTLAAVAGTHPQNDLRLVMQRILLTLDRYDRGRHVPRYPEKIPVSVLTELDRVDKGARLGRFVAPRDLAEALARLKAVPQLQRGEDDKTIEFNRLLLSVDAMLARRTSDLSDEEFRLFTEIAGVVARADSPSVLDREGMIRLFTADTYSREFLAYPPHERFMKKIPAYASPRYRGWLKANYLTTDMHGSLERGLAALVKIAPPAPLFEVFGGRIAELMPAALRTMNSRYVYEQNFGQNKSPEFQIRLAVLFHREVMPALTPTERGAFVAGHLRDYSYAVPQVPYGRPKNRGAGIITRRDLFLSDPGLKELRAQYREVIASIWENRGYYGMLDLITPLSRIDWRTIFIVLDIDPNVGRGQLRRAVKAYAATAEYAELLKTIRDSSGDSFREAKMGIGGEKALDWLDDTMAASLNGDGNDVLKKDPELRALSRKVAARVYYASRPALFRRVYLKSFSAALAGDAAPRTVEELGRVHRDLMAELTGPGPVRAIVPLADEQAAMIEASPLPAPTKKELLRAVFLEGYAEAQRVNGLTYENAGDWLTDGARGPAIMRALVRQGLGRDAREILELLLAREDFQRKARKDGFAGYAGSAGALKGELLAGLETALPRAPAGAKAALLTDFLATAVDPADGDYPVPEAVNTPELRALKERAVALSAPLDLTFAQSLAVFRRLTGSGSTPATDAFFRRRLEPDFDEDAASAAGLSLAEILESGRISSGELQLALARRVLEPEIARMEASARTPADLSRLVDTLNAYVRHGSMHKDEFLESLAWRLDITGRDLDAFIEDEKSYNWRKANPVLLRFGSGLSAEIGRLSRRGREDFIRYLIDPQGGRLPDPIVKEIESNAYQTALKINSAKDYPESPTRVREQSDRAAGLLRLQIEAALIDASPFERIPLYELLLGAGDAALDKSGDYPYDVMRAFLGYEKGSTEETMLAAFLAVVPEHERGVSLAYMLSQAGANKSSVKNLFEVFQTVGIKFGQMSSTWKLFGEEISRQTAALKNDARPMTKAEIMAVARRELSPEEFARIKRPVRVNGSASIKTVVLVELQDGREVVMMLRRPHAAEQIESNLRLGSDFLRELDRRGLGASSAMFETVLDAVREQLVGELSLTREAESLRAAKRHYDRLNESMGAELGPWRFRVPQPVAGFAERDSILFVEKAKGATYDRLSPGVRSLVGPLIADSSLNLLFREGWFDADRHTGNQLVDAEARVIYPLDFGQAAEFSRTAFWRSDDRYELAQFLRALSADDAAGVVRHGLAMSDRNPRDLDALQSRVRLILQSGTSTQDRIISLVGAFAEAEAPLDGRFTFGAFKGLMTLAGEDYLPDAAFREALGREIAALLRRKFPRTLSDDRR